VDGFGVASRIDPHAALAGELNLSEKTIEAHVHGIFTKLNLYPDPGDHRRVLAVLAFLRA
jgi:DNA-binding NarL/FixJ family response regulator